MTKGKKQQIEDQAILALLGPRVELNDTHYTCIGSLLDGVRCQRDGRDVVQISPTAGSGTLKMRRTPLGVLPPTLVGALGLEGALIDGILANARPRCARCDRLAERSEIIEPAIWPSSGYIALVVDGVEESLSLDQQCELLGAERALVEEKLVRRDELQGLSGEPVLLLVSSADPQGAVRQVEAWLSRGGGPLRLLHFESRDAAGSYIQKVFKGWRCSGCGAAFAAPDQQMIEAQEECGRCRGEGWISVDANRLVACEGCDGFGVRSPFAEYEFADTKLKHVASLSLAKTVTALYSATHGLAEVYAKRCETVCSIGLGDYPLGAPIDYLSRGEKTLATIASARLSGLRRAALVFDEGSIGADSSFLRDLAAQSEEPVLYAFAPQTVALDKAKAVMKGSDTVALQDLHLGPLNLDSFNFDVGDLLLVQGDWGTGKSLLLHEIDRRFAKRRKLAHLASFGSLKKSHLIEGVVRGDDIVLDLLGLHRELSREAARTRSAQERGLVEDDFVLSSSKYQCSICAKTAHREQDCDVCGGSLLERRVGEVLINKVPLAELLTSSLERLGAVLWSNDRIEGLIKRLPVEVQRELTLVSPVSDLPPATRRFLKVFSGLSGVALQSVSYQGELVLMDVPFGTTSSYQALIAQGIRELHAGGATIICAGVPRSLESLFPSVVRLQLNSVRSRVGDPSNFFDVRMARKTELCVERGRGL